MVARAESSEGIWGAVRWRLSAERFSASLEVGSDLRVGPGFAVVAVGLAPDHAGPLVAALAVATLARSVAAVRTDDARVAASAVGDAFERTDRLLARLGDLGVVDDPVAAEELARAGFSVPGRAASSAVVRGPLCASAAVVGGWGGAVVTAHVGDASVWRARGGRWERVGLPHVLGTAWGAAIPSGWEDETTLVLGPGLGERGVSALAEVRPDEAWAVTVGAGSHLRVPRRAGSGARARLELG